jgi:NAD(P)H-dependent nitrite reductase small subunit
MNEVPGSTDERDGWSRVCGLDTLQEGVGVCAWVQQRQIAIFRVAGSLYALDNFDPAASASVLSRGIVGDLQGERVVASPLYKHHYSLSSGRCLENPDHSLRVYPTRADAGSLWIQVLSEKSPPRTPSRPATAQPEGGSFATPEHS